MTGQTTMHGMNSKWMQKLGLIRVAILGVGGVILLRYLRW